MRRDDEVLVAGPRHPHAVYLQGWTVLGVRPVPNARASGAARHAMAKRSTGRFSARSSARPAGRAGSAARATEPVRCSGTLERDGVTRKRVEQWCVSHCVVTGHSSPNTTGRWSSYMETCTTCNGDGRCLSCGGSGTVGTWITHRCDTCHGRRVCGRCSGSGQVKKRSR